MNFHRSVAVLIKFFQLHKFFGNDGHSPSTVLCKHGALGRCSGNANAHGSAVPSATSKEPQLQPHLLLKHTEILRRLRELQPKRHPDWRLDEKQSAEMQDIVSQRVMTMTRQVGTTARFERDDVMTTAAVVPLERLPTTADDGLNTESATASNNEWLFGWNAETSERGKVWRCPTTSPKEKECTDQFTPGTSAADGMKREIPEFLTAAVEAKHILASKKRVHVTLRSPSGAPIVVKDRVDRNKLPLISLFHSSKQVCQIVPREPAHGADDSGGKG